jgi:hypothetical protein
VRFDRALLEDPVWQTKPPRERFDEVIRLMGETPRGSSATGGLPSAQQVAAAAEAAEAAAHASAGRRAPTHSDLPGGAAPAQSEQSRLEALTPTQLEAMFDGGVEIDALLAKLG